MALKKQWFKIKAPKTFGGGVIGSTPAVDENQLIGRVVEMALPDISKKYNQFHISLKFRITDVNEKAETELVGHEMQKERIYRMIRRGKRKVTAMGNFKTKDGVLLRVKTVFTLIRRVNTSLKDKARAKALEVIKKEAEKSTMEDLMKTIISYDLSKKIKSSVDKVYPCSGVEVYRSKVLEKN